MPKAPAKKRTTKKSSKSVIRHSDAIEQQLARYRSMRNFAVTAEPSGVSNAKKSSRAKMGNSQLPFVIQKHAATRLHYDFRLGWRGVLKSWAVTKGPSYFPGDKRLAVQVEDHPMEYGGFEGIIPKGQYGGGTVMLWDEGTWEPHGNADEGLEKGRLKFTLHGKKLKGDWALIRMGGKAAGEKKSNWLLIKEHDGRERGPDDPPVTEEEPNSVVTGRDLDAIAANQDHVWGSKGSRKQEPGELSSGDQKPAAANVAARQVRIAPKISLGNGPRESLPDFIQPQLATQMSVAPEGGEWIHELKLDGYRIQARIEQERRGSRRVQLLTRNALDWTHRMPGIAKALANLPAKSALLDGEVVVFDEHGATSFALLQAAFQEEKKQQLTYVVFDLLHLDGRNLRGLPLERRKEILRELLNDALDPDVVRFSDHLGANGQEIFRKACELGAEGIISKRRSAVYSPGRSGAWLKIKCVRQQEFVIAGFTPPSKTGIGIGALLLGYYRNGELIYAGRTGTGFTQKMRIDMRKRLDKMRQSRPAFSSLPAGAAQQAIWVQPKLVCEVKFATWTADDLVRQASFQALREDKSPTEVKREMPVDRVKESSVREADKHTASSTTKRPKVTAGTRGKAVATSKRAPSTAKDFPIPLTHPDKEVDSETKLTKRELADYFWAVRDHMLPYISHRPLSIVRCPQGSTQPCFFQKHVTDNLPDGIEGVKIRGRRSGVVENYITISSALGLAGLAQMGVLEIHPWGSTNDDIEKPNMLIFDLDPDEAIPWKRLAESAREVRDRLRQCKLDSFLKTTGGKGLHIVAPIKPEHDWPVVKEFAHQFAVQMESENRQLYLTKMTKAARKGKIFVDYLRNDRGATSIAPYSPRARRGAPVALPLAWDELDETKVPRFLVAEFVDWKSRLRHDPWKSMLGKNQVLRPEIVEKFSLDRGAA
jgi:bifunctional non-homologous end joining protein LigD